MKNTFGRTLAAQKLEILLENNPSARRKISSILSEFTHRMFCIVNCKDKNIIRLCWGLLKKSTIERIYLKKGLTKEMQSYTVNIIVSRYRVYLRNFNDLIPFVNIKREGI